MQKHNLKIIEPRLKYGWPVPLRIVFNVTRFRMVDIEINASSSLFLNLETNLILYLHPEKCIKFNQSK